MLRKNNPNALELIYFFNSEFNIMRLKTMNDIYLYVAKEYDIIKENLIIDFLRIPNIAKSFISANRTRIKNNILDKEVTENLLFLVDKYRNNKNTVDYGTFHESLGDEYNFINIDYSKYGNSKAKKKRCRYISEDIIRDIILGKLKILKTNAPLSPEGKYILEILQELGIGV